ncbi:putative S-layer associated protein [Paenibacillus mucilaginosus 3016]|uniref:Putative S-layer associated protein n=1 Tax=Paenibacillus mucilaginosus 3016 TaxID=1116391 RepID=H6NRR8_9BACL|nr:stalk domain-containing protein [Paenibacillus mucilaginosus]AFC32804.1 putative S-layer associated protein [Paenibacillus mucilaginosus 3016]WFA21266.1 S-layer protein [Paenibacillus mucilaginosus]
MNRIKDHRLWKLLLTFTLALTLLVLPAPPADAASFSYSAYPKGTVGMKKPTIGFDVAETDASPRFSAFHMKVDGQAVDGTLDTAEMSYIYTPSEELAPGTHTVLVTLQFDGYQPIENSWTFEVAENAVDEVQADYSKNQQDGLKAINDYRTLYGLQPLKLNPNLTLAAKLHASYLSANQAAKSGLSLHKQQSGLPGFVGEGPGDRAVYAGYYKGIGEDVSFYTGTLVESIDALFDAPYHRSPFLNPDAKDLGIEMVGDYVVIEFGFADESADLNLVVSPAPGDPYVPLNFDGYEDPDPIRMHTAAKYPVGYPIMAVAEGANITSVELADAKLTDSSGNPVELLKNSPANDDHLKTAAILIPKAPLQPDTEYKAYVKLNVSRGGVPAVLEKSWSFRTEPADGIGKTKLHADASAYLKLAELTSPLKHVVSFKLDSDQYTLDGLRFPMKRAPFLLDGSSYLWVRDLSAALGASVTWDDSRKAAIYTKNGRTITFFTNRGAYEINGKSYTTGSPARLENELTLIPVRLLSEVLGAEVKYNEATRIVTITY